MSFIRTRSGISNLHLFYGAEVVVFTEGGEQSLSLSEVDEGSRNTKSVDVKFWRDVLRVNGFDVKSEFRPVGSKKTLKQLCERVVSGEVDNVVVAMDRDMDGMLGRTFDSPRILYTKGYSWENDAFSQDLTKSQIDAMMMLVENPEEIEEGINKVYEDFKKIGRHLIVLEFVFRRKGVRFLSGFNGERFFNSKRSPFIDKVQVHSVLREKKNEIDRPVINAVRRFDVCPLMGVYGKLVMALSMTVVNYVCRIYGGVKSIPQEFLVCSMLERFVLKISDNPDDYYSHIARALLDDLGAHG